MITKLDRLKARSADYQKEINAGYNFMGRNGAPRHTPLQITLNVINSEIRFLERTA
jgi:hypothetical protein